MKNFFLSPKFKIFLAAVGTLDTLYLTWEHYAKHSVFCLSAASCDQVLSSSYAAIGPIPVSVIGLLYYGVLLALSIYFLKTRSERAVMLLFYITSAGFAMSLLFVGLQLFVIHAICYYCMLSALTTTLLFISSYLSMSETALAEK